LVALIYQHFLWFHNISKGTFSKKCLKVGFTFVLVEIDKKIKKVSLYNEPNMIDDFSRFEKVVVQPRFVFW